MADDLPAWGEDEPDEDEDEDAKQEPESLKERLIFLIDCQADMFLELELRGARMSCWEAARQTVTDLLKHKARHDPDDLVAVILYNTREKDGINEGGGGGGGGADGLDGGGGSGSTIACFEGVRTLLDAQPPSAEAVRAVRDLTEARFRAEVGSLPHRRDTALSDALWRAQHCLMAGGPRAAEGSLNTLVVFTNDPEPCGTGPGREAALRQLGSRVEALRGYRVGLRLVPLVPYGRGAAFAYARLWLPLLRELPGPAEGEAGGEGGGWGDAEALLRSMSAHPDHGVAALIEALKRRLHRKRSLLRARWDLGGGLRIAVRGYKLVGDTYKDARRAAPIHGVTNELLKPRTHFLTATGAAVERSAVALRAFTLEKSLAKGVHMPRVVVDQTELLQVRQLAPPTAAGAAAEPPHPSSPPARAAAAGAAGPFSPAPAAAAGPSTSAAAAAPSAFSPSSPFFHPHAEHTRASLSLLGFKPLSALRHHHQLPRSAALLRPDEPAAEGSTAAFIAVWRAMIDRGRFALCRFSRGPRSAPFLVALLPQDEVLQVDGTQSQPPGLHMVYLPYMDDIRAPERAAGVPRQEPTAEQRDAAGALLAALTWREGRAGAGGGAGAGAEAEEGAGAAGGEEEEFVEPMHMADWFPNHSLQRFYDVIEAVALSERIPPRDPTRDTARPSAELFSSDAAAVAIEAFRGAFPQSAAGRGTKRKAADGEGGAGPTKAQKAEAVAEAYEGHDWAALARGGELSRLTIDNLKLYLRRHALRLTGKKAELVERILDHMGLKE